MGLLQRGDPGRERWVLAGISLGKEGHLFLRIVEKQALSEMQPGFLRGKQAKGRAKGRGDQLMKFLPAFTVESQGSEIHSRTLEIHTRLET